MNFFSKTILTGLFMVLLLSCQSQKEIPAKSSEDTSEQKKSSTALEDYNKLISKEAISDEGLFDVHFKEDKIYYEIPLDLLGKDMLLVTRIAGIPSGFGGGYLNAGSKVNEQVIRWQKRGKNIDIKVITFENESQKDSPIHQSVVANNFFPVLFSSKILAYNADSTAAVIQVNQLFEEDIAALSGITPTQKRTYKVKKLDKTRSYIETANSYPENIEVKHLMTYEAETPPEEKQAGTISLLMNQSMILLPDDLMQPRLADNRVGWFNISKYNYNSEELKSHNYKIIRRWRLVPEDMEAYKNGELVAPIKPIVFYLDPATPEKWRPYFKQGIEDWNIAFEKAGFKNAIIAKDAPTKEEDPEFNPEDVRYSVVRYVASTTRNAMGPSVTDPRTGEILESDVIWYHNHLRSYRNRFMIEAGAQNPKARTLNTPEEEIGEMMRMVIAHEVGHSLGMPHNMKASSAYPTDSLRSPSFTKEFGLTPSIMDYARVNYVAQPEDEGVRYIRMLGPYDLYAINWGYRYLPEADGPEEEKEYLNNWVLKHQGNPIYEFGDDRGIDPQSQRESLGDDPVKASQYGVSNMKKVVPNLVEWTSKDGRGYEDLEEVYKELIWLWRGYVNHVATIVGGINETRKTADQEGVVYRHVSKERQIAAIEFLNENAFSTPQWLLEESILKRIEAAGTITRIQSLQEGYLRKLLENTRLLRMLENEHINKEDSYTVVEMMNALKKGIFAELYASKTVDIYRRNLQRSFIDIAAVHLKAIKEGEVTYTTKYDIVPIMRGVMEELRREINMRKNNNPDTLTQYHWKDLLARLEIALSTENG